MKLPKITQLVISVAELDVGSLVTEPRFLPTGQTAVTVLMGGGSRQKTDDPTDKHQEEARKEMYGEPGEQRAGTRPSLAGGGGLPGR